jgi:hypothetical protein
MHVLRASKYLISISLFPEVARARANAHIVDSLFLFIQQLILDQLSIKELKNKGTYADPIYCWINIRKGLARSVPLRGYSHNVCHDHKDKKELGTYTWHTNCGNSREAIWRWGWNPALCAHLLVSSSVHCLPAHHFLSFFFKFHRIRV